LHQRFTSLSWWLGLWLLSAAVEKGADVDDVLEESPFGLVFSLQFG
jgi:hypothetical protein